MAKHEITFSCGHSETRQLVGRHEDRQRYIKWAGETGLCDNCKRANRVEACQAVEAEHGLVALAGSEKQVAWARKIRAEKVTEVEAYFARMAERVAPAKVEMFDEQCSVIRQVLAGKAEARWWIDNRDLAETKLAELAFKEARS